MIPTRSVGVATGWSFSSNVGGLEGQRTWLDSSQSTCEGWLGSELTIPSKGLRAYNLVVSTIDLSETRCSGSISSQYLLVDVNLLLKSPFCWFEVSRVSQSRVRLKFQMPRLLRVGCPIRCFSHRLQPLSGHYSELLAPCPPVPRFRGIMGRMPQRHWSAIASSRRMLRDAWWISLPNSGSRG